MADLQEFDQLLSTTILAPRLSGSKVQKLASLSSQLVANDHHIVTAFFKLNASLAPASQSRISSLYVFDAIARGAKSDVNKGIGAQPSKERGKGTQAGLLSKMEGVVDSWIDGMLDDGKGGVWAEGREKTKKIVDIWSKNGTFPQHCLARLSHKVAGPGTSGSQAQAGPSIASPRAPAHRPLSSSSLGSGKAPGSTTPPYPPPSPAPTATAAYQPGTLPPEILKMLGMAKSPSPVVANNTPPGNTSASGGGTPAPPVPAAGPSVPTIPQVDIAAILASVTRSQTQPNNAQPPAPVHQSIPSGQNVSPSAPAGPNLANIDLSKLASILPPSLTAPTPTATASSSLTPSIPPARGGPSSHPNANPTLNNVQHAALAKFAALAQAGPQPPRSTPSGPGPGSRSAPHAGRSSAPGPLAPGLPLSPVKGLSQLPPDAGTVSMHAVPMRAGAEGGYRRGSYDREDGRHAPGPSREWGGHNDRRAGRERSASPDHARRHGRDIQGHDQGSGRPMDGGWGGRGRGGGSGRGRGTGRGGYGFNTEGHLGDREHDRGPRGRGGYEGDPTYSAPPRIDNPRGVTSGDRRTPSDTRGGGGGGGGRAPPPDWMLDRRGHEEEPAAAGDGEEDMALDESDDEGQAKSAGPGPGPGVDHGHGRGSGSGSGLPARPGGGMPQGRMQSQPQPQAQAQMSSDPSSHSTSIPAPASGPRLDTFDMSTFDPSQPASWTALAAAWKNTTGAEPGQMELMMFLSGGMGMGNGQTGDASQGWNGHGSGNGSGNGNGSGSAQHGQRW